MSNEKDGIPKEADPICWECKEGNCPGEDKCNIIEKKRKEKDFDELAQRILDNNIVLQYNYYKDLKEGKITHFQMLLLESLQAILSELVENSIYRMAEKC